MSMSEHDVAWDMHMADVAMDEMLADMRATVTEELRAGRLRAVLSKSRERTPIVDGLVTEARSLVGTSNRAALVLAFAAVEISATQLLLRPLFQDAIHHEAAAKIVLAVTERLSTERWCKLLQNLLYELVRFDLSEVKRPGAGEPVIPDVIALAKLRNQVLHTGAEVTDDEAWRACFVSSHWVEYVYGYALQVMGA